jgi:phage terminase Nu1 subunit (DNA packaging protein)
VNDTLLFGWKEIARFIGCSVDTAKRYWKQGMPVYRVTDRGAMQGIPGDIVKWLRKRKK